MNRTLLGFLTALAPACADDECFVSGTRIATPRGDRPIEDLAPGDVILAFDLTHRRVVQRRVLACHRARASQLFRITAGDVVVRGVTKSHPVYDAHCEAFVRVDEIGPCASLVVWSGPADPHTRPVSTLEATTLEDEVDVFNLSVEGAEQTYFADGVLVHNKSYLGGTDRDQDGFYAEDGDCDDLESEVHPGATEVCNGKDDDCDGEIDEESVCGAGGNGGGGGAIDGGGGAAGDGGAIGGGAP